jgi:hypothetical protein
VGGDAAWKPILSAYLESDAQVPSGSPREFTVLVRTENIKDVYKASTIVSTLRRKWKKPGIYADPNFPIN